MDESLTKHVATYTNAERRAWNTIVIGGGQAGLAAGYYLKNRGIDFVILDAEKNVGDAWRKRWDSLKLFSPPPHNALPGLAPKLTGKPTTKDAMADYLAEYAIWHSLPIRLGIGVTLLSKTREGFSISTNSGIFTCTNVIVATGSHQRAKYPEFAKDLNPAVFQIHSSKYKNATSLPPGEVLVVGSATSGIEIGMEVSKSRPTTVSGKPSFVLPKFMFLFGRKFTWWFVSNVLTIRTPIGRNAKKGIVRGGAVAPGLLKLFQDSGVRTAGRVVGIRNGWPLLADGRELPVSTVIWCTGDKPDFSWIDMEVLDRNRWPVARRGVAKKFPGLYFVGMPFQFGLSSALVGGVARDAEFVVKHIAVNQPATRH